jgi:hypothetical protein
MKHSNYVGIVAALLLIGCCFLPWVYIVSIKLTITGLKTEHTRFGQPGLLHIIFSVFSIILFLFPVTWAKSTNLFIATFNFAWSLRNFLLIPLCELGECPQKLLGIYAIIVFSIIMFAMALIPKVNYKE